MRPATWMTLLLVGLLGGAASASAQCELRELSGSPSIGFGWTLAIDGNRAIVANAYTGKPAAFIIDIPTGSVIQRIVIPKGFTSAVDLEGDRAVIGYDTSPEFLPSWAYVFEVSSGNLLYKVTSNEIGWDNFGRAVAIEGDRLLVGSSGSSGAPGVVYVYDLWTGVERMQIRGPTQHWFGSTLDASGDMAITGPWIGGSAFILDLKTGKIAHELTTTSGTDLLSVAIDGDRAVVGAPYLGNKKGAAFIFDVYTGVELVKLTASDGVAKDWFGSTVAIDGDLVIVGAQQKGDRGGVYFFDLRTGEELLKLTKTHAKGFGSFGLALGGRHVLVTTPGDPQSKSTVQVYKRPTLIGSRYCPAETNSTGAAGALRAEGAETASCNCLHLHASRLPIQQVAMILGGSAQNHVPFAGGGQGTLCVGGTVARFQHLAGETEADGSLRHWIDLKRLPPPLGTVVQPGETWNFQVWYRDMNPGPTSNFTNGLSITFR